MQDKERMFLENVLRPLSESGVRANYYKCVADLNPWLLYPESVIGRDEEIRRTMAWFCLSLQNFADQNLGPGMIRVFPFSRIYNLFENQYREAYNQIKYNIQQDKDGNLESPFIRKKVLRNELEQLLEHCGISEDDRGERIQELTKRVVGSYAAEEFVIRDLLSQEGWFPNPVAVSNESMFTLPILATAYTGKEARGPWLFLLYENNAESEKGDEL